MLSCASVCRQRAEPGTANGAVTGQMQINDAFIPFLQLWRVPGDANEGWMRGEQGGQWPEVKERKRGGAGQLHTPAPAIAASLQVYVSIDVVHA